MDNLFFYLDSQSVSCKASLAALRLYNYFVIFVVLLSENKYDDDDVAHGIVLDAATFVYMFS